MADTFSLLTLNSFGLCLPKTKRRLLALARIFDRSPYDIICLQELQLHKYQELLVSACPSYAYSFHERYFHCPKGGLLTLARLPIVNQVFEPYQERGFWYTPMLLDTLFYKGMSITEFKLAEISIVVINTHLLANFAGNWDRHGMYAHVEEKQLHQLAKTVREQPADTLVIVAGDLNIPRGSELYQEFLANSGLTDPLAGDSRPTLRVPIKVRFHNPLAIDYVLYRMPDTYSFQIDCDLAISNQYRIGKGYEFLSDHHGIEMRMIAK